MKKVTLIPALITSFGLAACGGSTTGNDGGVVQQAPGKFGGTTSVS